MYRIRKTFEIAGSHKLDLPYESKCCNQHGHNWIITIYCQSAELDENGMVIDFTKVKKLIHDKLDHKCLNDVPGLCKSEPVQHIAPDVSKGFNPTAERIAEWICMQIDCCYAVEVQESEGNVAIYQDEGFGLDG
jgi:6-pyruvoyltetrahydropterin/6-carboxytetrahydropterin synthase